MNGFMLFLTLVFLSQAALLLIFPPSLTVLYVGLYSTWFWTASYGFSYFLAKWVSK